MFGLMLAFSSMVCIPAYAILKLYNTTGVNFKQVIFIKVFGYYSKIILNILNDNKNMIDYYPND